jgi:DNA (cytosine-5)-methyltransferase 1
VRNNLFQKFFALVAQTKPTFFVAENVLGILSPQHRELREAALSLVSSDYELLEPLKLKACDFGAPTSRERVFFIGYLSSSFRRLSSADFLERKVKTPTCVQDALQGLPAIRNSWLAEAQGWRCVAPLPESEYSKNICGNIPEGVGDDEALRRYKTRIVSGCMGTNHSAELRARYGALKPGGKDDATKSVRLKKLGLCPTLRAGTGSDRGSYQAVRPIHPTAPRVITPREAARLQGFPDWFRFAPSKWHSFRQIGNSVSPFVAEAVLSTIYSKLRFEHA